MFQLSTRPHGAMSQKTVVFMLYDQLHNNIFISAINEQDNEISKISKSVVQEYLYIKLKYTCPLVYIPPAINIRYGHSSTHKE
jgi:hypothetical protein